mgnify:CR=1 FL=1|jgi:hypothetical protein
MYMEFLRQYFPKLHFHCKCLADVDIEEPAAMASDAGSQGHSLPEPPVPSRGLDAQQGPCDPTWAPS